MGLSPNLQEVSRAEFKTVQTHVVVASFCAETPQISNAHQFGAENDDARYFDVDGVVCAKRFLNTSHVSKRVPADGLVRFFNTFW